MLFFVRCHFLCVIVFRYRMTDRVFLSFVSLFSSFYLLHAPSRILFLATQQPTTNITLYERIDLSGTNITNHTVQYTINNKKMTNPPSSPAATGGNLSSLSIDHDSSSNHLVDENNANEAETEELTGPPLDQRILDIVKSMRQKDGNYVIKPARISAEIGMSVEDAAAELCGLLAAVGGGHDGASFAFEKTSPTTSTMVFTFPPDFEARAKRRRRQEDLKQYLRELFHVFVKALKIVTAFGLILSLFILTVAAMIGLVVATVAMSQGGNSNRHQRNMLVQQLRALFYTIRQLLWCYALFGQELEGQDPFMSEIAYDLALLSSICCVNPGGFFWWYRVGQLNRRRRMARRGWNRGLFGTYASQINSNNPSSNELETDVEGVFLVRRGDWGHQDDRQQAPTIRRQEFSSQDEHRGLLSLAVEYLFGPSPFDPGPTDAEKWKLRGAAIVQLLSKDESSGVSLQDLIPYLDDPPKASDQEISKIVAGGLEIVAHFSGTPADRTIETDKNTSVTPVEPHKAKFNFPELMAESQYATRYEPSTITEDNEDDSWQSLLYDRSNATTLLGRSTLRTGDSAPALPKFLYERPYKFTKLQPQQVFYCFSLGVINLVGVVWLRASFEPPNGMLQIPDGSALATVVKHGLGPVLYFYARLFFFLPTARLILILGLNKMRKTRNEKRKMLASTNS